MEQILVKDIAVDTWEMMRLARHKTIAIERRFRLNVAFQARRREAQQQRKEEIGRILSGQANPKAERAV